MKCIVVVLMALVLSACGDKNQFEINSPDASLKVTLKLSSDGRAFYQVHKNGHAVLLPSQLGVALNNQTFDANLSISKVTSSFIQDDYILLHGKQKNNHYRANEALFSVKNNQGDAIDVVFQVSNDGVAFQYRFPNINGELQSIIQEITQFAFAPNAKAWMQPIAVAQTGWSNTNPSYEEHYQMAVSVGTESPSEAGWVFPALFNVDKHWVLISEAGITSNYHASRLNAKSPNGVYQVANPMDAERYQLNGKKGTLLAESRAAFSSPWRLMLVGGLDTIIASTLGTDLAAPASANMDFVKPGLASWSWALLKDDSVNYDTQIDFIDYAANMGWSYTLVDALWDTQIGYERTAKLAEYAHAKNVGLLVWYNSSGDWNVSPQTPKGALLTRDGRRKEFAKLQKMGIKGIKVDFFPGDGQSVVAYYIDIAKDAADFNLLVNFHGSTLPRGLQRTYPNIMTAEAVHGFEMITFVQGSADVAAKHMTMLPFTRNAFDPMDFTPTTFSDIPNIARRTLNGFELALPVLFLSGIQHIAETPSGMAKVPAYVKTFMQTVPVAWDESRLIDGYPGEYVVIARRSGNHWYVAGINAKSSALQLNVDLGFIEGQAAALITDDPANNVKTLGFMQQPITAKAKTPIRMLPNGGFVAVFDAF